MFFSEDYRDCKRMMRKCHNDWRSILQEEHWEAYFVFHHSMALSSGDQVYGSSPARHGDPMGGWASTCNSWKGCSPFRTAMQKLLGTPWAAWQPSLLRTRGDPKLKNKMMGPGSKIFVKLTRARALLRET